MAFVVSVATRRTEDCSNSWSCLRLGVDGSGPRYLGLLDSDLEVRLAIAGAAAAREQERNSHVLVYGYVNERGLTRNAGRGGHVQLHLATGQECRK
jgi:hypothetical protein